MVVSSVLAPTMTPCDVHREDGSMSDLSSDGTLGWLSSCGRRSAKAMFMEIKDASHYWYLAEGVPLKPLMVVRLGTE